MVFGLVIVAVGVIALLESLGVIDGSVWQYAWPVILIIIGLSFVFGRFRRHRRWWWGGPPWMWHDRGNDKDDFGSPWDNKDKPTKE
jgi:hypothetical protein